LIGDRTGFGFLAKGVGRIKINKSEVQEGKRHATDCPQKGMTTSLNRQINE
jgi:hypothetical protein